MKSLYFLHFNNFVCFACFVYFLYLWLIPHSTVILANCWVYGMYKCTVRTYIHKYICTYAFKYVCM